MRVIDLFCGCGGLSLGFQNAGHEIISAYDNWDVAINIYRKNFTHPIYNLDLGHISDFSEFIKQNPDIIIGGPPCQDYSTAGSRDESKGRARLTISFANIVAAVKPIYFVMENVPSLQKSENFTKANSIFKKAGYGLTQLVLDASLCGVPQTRKRFVTIGKLGSKDGFMTEVLLKNQSDKKMTVRDYLGDKLGVEYYFRVPTSYARRGIYSIDEPSMTIRGVDRPVPKGYKGHNADPVPLTPDIRSLTYRERSLIQTFPEDFIWEGSKTDINQAIGNAVPVKLAEYIANCINEYDSKEA